MSLLSGLGRWLRNEADNVGSFVTGQPAHGPAPAPQTPAPAPPPQQFQPQTPQLPSFHPGQQPFQQQVNHINGANPAPQQGSPQAPPQIRLNHPNPLLTNRSPVQIGAMRINQPQVPQNGGSQQANTDPVGQFIKPFGDAARGLASSVTQLTKTPYDIGRTIPASITHNPVALVNANKAANKDVDNAVQFAQFVPRALVQGAESLNPFNHPSQRVITPGNNPIIRNLLGKQPIPSVQNVYKTTQQQSGTPTAAGTTAVTVLSDLLAGKGAKDTTVKGSNLVHKGIQALGDANRTGLLKTATQTAPVQNIPIKNLTSYEGAPDRAKVDQYKQQIAAGQPTEPLVALRDSKGNLGIEDGKHRLQAYQELGHTHVPVKVTTPEDLNKIIQGGYARIPGAGENKPISSSGDSGGQRPIGLNDSSTPTVPSKGFIIKETKARGGRQDVIRIKKNPETGHLEQYQESIVAPKAQMLEKKPNVVSADPIRIGKALGMTDEELARATAYRPPAPKDIPNEPIKLTRQERQSIIKNNEYQEPTNPINLKTHEENVKGAIAEAVGTTADERMRYENLDRLQHKLSPEDRNLMYRYDNGEDINKLAKEAKDPERFKKAAIAARDALDHSLGVDRAAGGVTLRQKNYIPHSYKADPETMDKLGIEPDQRFHIGPYTGFHDTSAKYPSYIEAANQTGGLLKPLHENPFDAIHEYGQGATHAHEGDLLKQALLKAAPNDIGDLGDVSIGSNRLHSAPHDLPFSATDRVMRQLNGYKEQAYINNTAVRLAGKAFDAVNATQKKLLFSLAWFHQVNISLKYAAATLGSGHAKLMGKGLAEAIASGVHPKIAEALDKKYLTDGTADWQRENGVMHGVQRARYRVGTNDSVRQKIAIASERFNPLDMMHRSMGNFINAYANVLSQFAKDRVPSGTAEATALAQEYNALLGHIDTKISNLTPFVAQSVRRGGLAPQFLLSQGKLLKDAAVGTKGAAYAKTGIGLTNATDVARTAVIGNRVINAAVATAITYIASGQMPTFQQVLQRSGITGNFTGPNIDLGEKNKKGEHQVEYLPTDYIGLFENLVKDPAHFGAARYSPAIAAVERFATNKDWNGNPLSDPNSPNALRDRVLGASKGFLPIGVQNLTNSNLSVQQKVEQEFGTRAHVSPSDPQVQATKQYFDTKSKLINALKNGDYGSIDPSLKGLDPKYANELVRKWNAMHPSDNKDITGTSLPKMYDPHTAGEKRNNYTMVDKDGNQQLSPLFYIDKKLASIDPSRPHSPVFDLTGDGVDHNTFKPQSKVLVALNYSAAKNEDPSEAAAMLESNPWLIDYSKQARTEAANYKPNLTAYMQKEGWTQPAIDDYWKKHPDKQSPIEDVNIDQSTQDVMDQYHNMADGADKIAYLKDHPEILVAENQIAQRTNEIRRAGGQLELKGYPAPSDHVKQILDSLPKGTDKGAKKQSFSLINSNKDVQDYLADISAHGVEFEGAKARFTGEDVNQKLLKSVYSMGKYDVVKNKDGTYSLVAGTTASGTPLAQTGQAFTPGKYGSSATGPASAQGTGTVSNAAGKSGGNSKHKKIIFKKRHAKRIKVRHAKKPHIFLKKPPNPVKIKNKVNDKVGIHSKTYL